MDVGLLEDFLALVDELNFSAAAARRNLTQPAFSRHIQALETWIGVPLLRRTSRSVALTQAGQVFHPRAAAIVRDLKRACDEVQESAGRSERSLSIAATHALSFTFVPKWMLQTVGHASFGSINLISDTYEECEALLLRGDAIFLICHRRPETRNRLSTRQFSACRIGGDVLAPLCLPDARGKPCWELGDDQPSAPFLAYAAPSGLGRILEDYWAAGGSRPNLRVKFRSRLAATLQEMVKEGQGVAWVPISLAERELASGQLVPAGGPDFEVPVDIALIRPASALNAHAEHFWRRVVVEAKDAQAD